MFSKNSLVMRMHRRIMEDTYTDTCDVVEHQKTKVNGVAKFGDVTVLKNIPCRLSYSSAPTANQTESSADIVQTTKLFISPDVEIKSGSKILVTRDGHTMAFKNSGVPSLYPTHNEIMLETFKNWA